MKVVVADSGQIEARMLSWLAGHNVLTAMFARSIVERTYDVYSEIGTELFGQKISKDETPLERQVAKSLALGLGFQLGWYRLAMEMAKGMLGSAPVTFDLLWVDRLNVDLNWFAADEKRIARIEKMPSRLPLEERVVHCAVAHHLVRWYRSNNQPIVDFWETCGEVIERMLEIEPGKGEAFGTNDCLIAVRHGVQLPNDLTLRYNGLRKSESVEDGELRTGYSYMGGPVGKERKRIYSGLLTENVVQALARVAVYQQALAIYRKYGLRFATTSHDELVYVCRDAEAELCLERVLAEMKTPPAWAPGLPITAEGSIGASYGDAK